MSLLINQLDTHNEGNILATIKYKVARVIFIRRDNEQELMDNMREYYKLNFSHVRVDEIIVKEGDIKNLKSIINKYNNKDLIVNLTGGSRINSLALLDICKSNNITCIYMDIKGKRLFKFKNGINLNHEEYEDLEIADIINAAGGILLEDSSSLCKQDDLVYLSQKIYENLDLWHKYKLKLYEGNIFKHDSQNPNKIIIHTESLDEEEKEVLNIILVKLQEMNEIKYKINNNIIDVTLLNKYIKGFIFKSGTWLEIATNNLIKKIKEIDETKNGVVFLWNNYNRTVKNEVDVVAVKDSIPIFISCKDSDRYNEMALNELDVYANKIGGEDSYKILVATKEPVKAPVRKRAEEMGISIVIFDGNENKFIKEIKKIIRNK